MATVLLLTPPFTQLNTPYPATAYLKGFLNQIGVPSCQVDLGINVISKLFTPEYLQRLFDEVKTDRVKSFNAQRIYNLRDAYVESVSRVMNFLSAPSVLEAQNICQGNILPEAGRFSHLEDVDEAFGTMGLLDKAKHFCTLYLEDLSDFIIEAVDSNFGFSRYAERLGRSAGTFDEIYANLKSPLSFIESILIDELSQQMSLSETNLVLITIPFPGNLIAALRIGQWLKQHCPQVKVSFGGGFVNTELRSLKDKRFFEFCDFVTLDDGELPIKCLIEHVNGQRGINQLKRTLLLENNQIVFANKANDSEPLQEELGVPDYSDVEWNRYISVVEVANPMFRLWSDGQWVKLTLAHGCYWGKCSFCDGTLDYIKRYDPASVKTTADRIEAIVAQTGKTGFHFVDEAAPPALLKELAIEILRRNIKIVWWTNIRFEKNFTADLCLLLKQSGCIAVAGGLEVASERILKLINKGVTLEQVSNVAANLKQAGIMVHAYLMYGFPSQTAQETIDSLEVVRQLFELGIIESGFWHQFALTAHSPVGHQPDKFGISISSSLTNAFANNDLEYVDNNGAVHDQFGEGLKKALYNYMHGLGFGYRLSDWFDFKVPQTSLPPHFIESKLKAQTVLKESSQLVWLANPPIVTPYLKRKGNKELEMLELSFYSNKTQASIKVKKHLGQWICTVIEKASLISSDRLLFSQFRDDYESNELGDFDKFINSYTFLQLQEGGLLIV